MRHFFVRQGRRPNFKSGSTAGIYWIFRGLKFELDAASRKNGSYAKVSPLHHIRCSWYRLHLKPELYITSLWSKKSRVFCIYQGKKSRFFHSFESRYLESSTGFRVKHGMHFLPAVSAGEKYPVKSCWSCLPAYLSGGSNKKIKPFATFATSRFKSF